MYFARPSAEGSSGGVHRRLSRRRLGCRLDLLHRLVDLANSCSGCVERYRAATDDHHAIPDIDPIALIEVEEVINSLDDSIQLVTREFQIAPLRSTDREEDRFETLSFECLEVEVLC